jgi:hypothetical protein
MNFLDMHMLLEADHLISGLGQANRRLLAWPFAQQFAMLPPQQVLRNLS